MNAIAAGQRGEGRKRSPPEAGEPSPPSKAFTLRTIFERLASQLTDPMAPLLEYYRREDGKSKAESRAWSTPKGIRQHVTSCLGRTAALPWTFHSSSRRKQVDLYGPAAGVEAG